ncbi:hypothetical protein ACLB2K_073178 [Fragaria x ananassa]
MTFKTKVHSQCSAMPANDPRLSPNDPPHVLDEGYKMSQKFRPMVAGGWSSGEEAIGVPAGFSPLRWHYRF